AAGALRGTGLPLRSQRRRGEGGGVFAEGRRESAAGLPERRRDPLLPAGPRTARPAGSIGNTPKGRASGRWGGKDRPASGSNDPRSTVGPSPAQGAAGTGTDVSGNR